MQTNLNIIALWEAYVPTNQVIHLVLYTLFISLIKIQKRQTNITEKQELDWKISQQIKMVK